MSIYTEIDTLRKRIPSRDAGFFDLTADQREKCRGARLCLAEAQNVMAQRHTDEQVRSYVDQAKKLLAGII